MLLTSFLFGLSSENVLPAQKLSVLGVELLKENTLPIMLWHKLDGTDIREEYSSFQTEARSPVEQVKPIHTSTASQRSLRHQQTCHNSSQSITNILFRTSPNLSPSLAQKRPMFTQHHRPCIVSMHHSSSPKPQSEPSNP